MGILDGFKKNDRHRYRGKIIEVAPISEPSSKEDWNIGYKIRNRYEIRDIKEGGMGIVYIAYDHLWKQYFAIKTFKKEYLWNENAVNRFMREAETWINLDMHENIVLANLVVKIEGKPLIFLEYIDGGDLSDYIGKLDIPKAIHFAFQFCGGMDYAYNKSGIIHRDIKPSNVLITKKGLLKKEVLKITDFGLVKSLDYDIEEIESEGVPENIFLSKTGAVAGTPPYMSPEQFIDTKHVGVESDIYSFGVMFYEMLTGRIPFYANSFEEYMDKHLNEKPIKPSELNPEISNWKKLDFVVMKCLEKNPKDRFHRFREILNKADTGKEWNEGKKLPAEWWFNKGASFAGLGKYEEAIECFDKGLRIKSGIDMVWYNKGIALDALERYEEAIECYDKAININPRFFEAWYNKGNSLITLRKYKEALKCFDKALKINSRNESIWNNKGSSLNDLGKYNEAIKCFDKAIDINPRHEKARYNKGNALDALGRYEEAIECYDKALEINPRYEQARKKREIALNRLHGT